MIVLDDVATGRKDSVLQLVPAKKNPFLVTCCAYSDNGLVEALCGRRTRVLPSAV
jgi:hypothetical protein